jgi:hypothetical protein
MDRRGRGPGFLLDLYEPIKTGFAGRLGLPGGSTASLQDKHRQEYQGENPLNNICIAVIATFHGAAFP